MYLAIKASRWTGMEIAHNTALPVITIDGSPNWIHSWPLYCGQEKVINYCQAPAVIPEILPKAKFLRNPSSASYSCTVQGFSLAYFRGTWWLCRTTAVWGRHPWVNHCVVSLWPTFAYERRHWATTEGNFPTLQPNSHWRKKVPVGGMTVLLSTTVCAQYMYQDCKDYVQWPISITSQIEVVRDNDLSMNAICCRCFPDKNMWNNMLSTAWLKTNGSTLHLISVLHGGQL